MTDIFDFGFTAVDESELEVVREAEKNVDESLCTIEEAQTRLNNLYNAIIPLLSNLKQNPDKDYIYWPNRTGKVEAFEDLIRKIIED